nr:probable leucine-rich repeat receptor-like protein kinase At1g35710 [Ziziphus jujuba var. spinosa]
MDLLMEKSKFPLFFLFFVTNLAIIVVFASNEEAIALSKWKASLQNSQPLLASWTDLPNGTFNSSTELGATTTPCNWFGIYCDLAGKVIMINLTSSGLQGTLNEFMFSHFPNLLYLDLSMNFIFGAIPPEISYLSKLVYLDLSNNKLSGYIPEEVGLLSGLEGLMLFDNKLNGSFPKEIGSLRSLRELSLHNNSLSGLIPTSLGI